MCRLKSFCCCNYVLLLLLLLPLHHLRSCSWHPWDSVKKENQKQNKKYIHTRSATYLHFLVHDHGADSFFFVITRPTLLHQPAAPTPTPTRGGEHACASSAASPQPPWPPQLRLQVGTPHPGACLRRRPICSLMRACYHMTTCLAASSFLSVYTKGTQEKPKTPSNFKSCRRLRSKISLIYSLWVGLLDCVPMSIMSM